jgi:aspartyl-tRNA(Asn)/glutamyl-tRNA(Gln) amidotransferase subunit A
MFAEIGYLSAGELVTQFRLGTLSPVDVTRAMLDRVEEINPSLNALYLIDTDGALTSARASEDRWRRKAPIGLLDGVPITLKDALLTKGMPTYRGSAAIDVDGAIWDTDAPAVARVKEAGAVILGKTTMCDFGMLAAGVSSKYGVTRNPWNTDYNTGGSSSGAAACVSAGIGPVTIGTDIVGSVRLPGSFCGLVGHKPSQGRVPYYFPSSPSLVAGPLARTVDDAALMMNVLTSDDPRDFSTLPPDGTDYVAELRPIEPPARIGLLTDIGFGLVTDTEVAKAVDEAAAVLENIGFSITKLETPFGPDDDRAPEAFYRVRCLAEFAACPSELQELAPTISKWTEPAHQLTAIDHHRAYTEMMVLREKSMAMMLGLDFLILPSVPVPPYAADVPSPDADRLFAPWCNTFLFNLTEQPAISVNCGFTKAGLPIGLQIVGQRFDDLGVLRMASTYEAAASRQPDWSMLV